MPTAAVAGTGRRHLSHTHMIQETAGLTIRLDCTAVLHLALSVLTALATPWPGRRTVLHHQGRLEMRVAPGRRTALLTPSATPRRDLHRILAPTLARHRTRRGVESMPDSVHAPHRLVTMPALETSGRVLRTIISRQATQTPGVSRYTSRKRRRKRTVDAGSRHLERQVAMTERTRADSPITPVTMADFPATTWICLLATDETEQPTVILIVIASMALLKTQTRRVIRLHLKRTLCHSRLTTKKTKHTVTARLLRQKPGTLLPSMAHTPWPSHILLSLISS